MATTARTQSSPGANSPAPQKYLVGGGIASMAAAVFLIRDGNAFGQNITIIEESGKIGGSLDGAGSPEEGYVLRGGRMLESKYLCTFGLFASIPTLDESETVTQETLRWNETMKTSSKSRLFRDGHRQTAPKFGLSEKHILTIERLVLEPEGMLGRTRIAEQFDPKFRRQSRSSRVGTSCRSPSPLSSVIVVVLGSELRLATQPYPATSR
jgi:oleate hydratase